MKIGIEVWPWFVVKPQFQKYILCNHICAIIWLRWRIFLKEEPNQEPKEYKGMGKPLE